MVRLLKGGYRAFVSWSQQVIKDSEERTGDPIEAPIARARLGAMMNATQGLRARPTEKMWCSDFKYRNVDKFSDEEFARLSSGNVVSHKKNCADAATTAHLLREIANMDMDSKEARLDPLSARVSSAISVMSGHAFQNSSQVPVAIKLVTQSQSSVDKKLSLYENASANTHPDLCRRFAQAHKSSLPPTDCVEADDMSWRNVDGLNRGSQTVNEMAVGSSLWFH